MPGFIPWRKVDLLLRSQRTIWISTTRPDGRPHAVPVWYWGDGQAVYFATPRQSQKAKNLRRQPWVIVHAGDGDDVLILEGTATEVSDPDDLARLNADYREKYVDPHSGAQAIIPNEGDIVFRVPATHVMTWEYGVVATRTDWHIATAG
jgi:PPOX class probable F420-dependent enzyme